MLATQRQVGERVKGVRLKRGLLRKHLAARVGVSKDVIYRLEAGKIVPRIVLMTDIAEALETTVEALTGPDSPGMRKHPRPRLRVRTRARGAPETGDNVELPIIVTQLLMSGRLGIVTASELQLLIQNSHDPAFGGDLHLLELECLWRRACGAMHKHEYKIAVDEAFERIRQELQRSQ